MCSCSCIHENKQLYFSQNGWEIDSLDQKPVFLKYSVSAKTCPYDIQQVQSISIMPD